MAKLSARGAHKIASFDARLGQEHRDATFSVTFALRSDGKVLRKLRSVVLDGDPYESSTGYKLFGSVKHDPTDPSTLAKLKAALVRRGYELL